MDGLSLRRDGGTVTVTATSGDAVVTLDFSTEVWRGFLKDAVAEDARAARAAGFKHPDPPRAA